MQPDINRPCSSTRCARYQAADPVPAITHTHVALHGPIHGQQQGNTSLHLKIQCKEPQITNNQCQPARISRSIPGNGPVEDATSIDVQCNAGSAPAPLHAAAAAGSDVTLRWTLWPDSHVGPLITYMARCPDTGCQDWSPGTS